MRRTLFLYGAIISATLAVVSFIYNYGRNVGRNEAYDKVQAATEKVANASEKERARALLCGARGGVWNVAARRCDTVSADRRN